MVVFAKDLARMAAFYEAILDRRVLDEDATWARFGGADELVLHAIPEEVARTFEIADPPTPREDAAIKPWFTVASIAAARATAPHNSGRVLGADQEWRFGDWLVCDGVDPEGNVFQLRERVD
jgi:catechol 2,3-dioxygenase-like lactoylglutathione lyase family enzyme